MAGLLLVGRELRSAPSRSRTIATGLQQHAHAKPGALASQMMSLFRQTLRAYSAGGIDLGTTDSCVAVMEGKLPNVIENSESARTTSVGAFASKGERDDGTQAVTDLTTTLCGKKRLIGRQLGDDQTQKEAQMLPYSIAKGPKVDAWVEAGGQKKHSPSEVGAFILGKMRETVGFYLGRCVSEAVITVPSYAIDAQGQGLKHAGRVAGLDVLRIIKEPTVASLSYGMDKKAAENVQLCPTAQTDVIRPFITADASGEKHHNVTLTHSKFEDLGNDFIEHTKQPCKDSVHVRCPKQPWILSSMTTGFSGIFSVSSGRDNNNSRDFMIVPKDFTRGFAKTVAVPPNMQKPMKLRLYMGSPGVIGEPYKKPPPPLPILRRWFTKEGWKRRKKSFMGMIKTSYTIAKLRQKTKGYSQQRFYQDASDLYKQINVALAEGERTALRQLVTDSVFSVMKNELKHRKSSWATVKWEMVGPINKIRTLQGRLIGVDKNNHDNAFVQLTLRILSKQKFAAYDKNGKLVAGDPDKELLVEDYWVFERPLLIETKWRLCGRITV